MSAITTKEAIPLAAPYQRKIGNVTFVVSSFGNPRAKSTAEGLLLGMLEAKLMQETIEKEAQSA